MIEVAPSRRRAVDAPHLVVLAGAGARVETANSSNGRYRGRRTKDLDLQVLTDCVDGVVSSEASRGELSKVLP